jgi:hypothetical protein
VRVDDRVPYRVYGGLQDNGSWVGPSEVWENGGIRNHHWREVAFGDGFDTVPIRGDEDRGYAMSQEGHLVRWDLDTGERKMIRPAPAEPAPDEELEPLRFNWNAAIAPDPFDPDTVYFGSQYVHRSRDRGETWEVISPDLTTDRPEWQRQGRSGGLTLDVTGAENFTTLVALAPSPVERGVIWAGSDDGRLHLTRDGGATWTSVEGGVRGVPANTWIPHVEASPHDAATAFVVFDNHRRSDWTPYVYRTTDYGRTWTRLVDGDGARSWEEGEGGVRGYALSIVQDPVDPDLLFLGTELGLWASFDGGASWLPWRHGVPTVSVMDLAIQPREGDLVVATHGRSLYVVDDVSPLRHLDPAALAEPLHLFPPAPAQQHRVAQSGSTRFAGHGELRAENEPYGALITFAVSGDDLPLPDPDAERERRLPDLERLREEGAENLAAPTLAAGVPEAAEPAETGEEEAEETGEEGDAEEEAAKDEMPKAEIEVRTPDGELVRRFETEVHRGVNRAVWDLAHDAPAEPDRGDLPRWNEPSGPEAVPGDYVVTVRFRGEEASTPLTVAADPRFAISDADRRAKLAALDEAGALQETLTTAIDRLKRTQQDVATLLARHAAAKAEAKRAAGGVPATGDDAEDEDELARRGKKLEKAVGEQIERLWTPPGGQDIPPDTTPWDDVGRAGWMLGADWAAPTPAQRRYLAIARAAVARAVGEVNRFYAEEVAPFRQAVRDSGLALLPEHEPLAAPAEGR